MSPDYTTVTEKPGLPITPQQLEMIYTRYYTASRFCQGKDLLEVGCGPGIGLGYLANIASTVVAGDIDKTLLKQAQSRYKNQKNIHLRSLDAHKLPFEHNSFDVVLLFETIYYLSDPEKFLGEAYRILRRDGVLLISMANKDCPEFVESPFSLQYYSVPELANLLKSAGFGAEFFGTFPLRTSSIKQKFVSFTRRLATAFNLMPGSLETRARLKRIFYGKLLVMPDEIDDGMVQPHPLESISIDSTDTDHKVLYAISKRL